MEGARYSVAMDRGTLLARSRSAGAASPNLSAAKQRASIMFDRLAAERRVVVGGLDGGHVTTTGDGKTTRATTMSHSPAIDQVKLIS